MPFGLSVSHFYLEPKHYWAREMEALGQEVKMIAPQYVRPFVKRQKNNAADAEAIFIAARL